MIDINYMMELVVKRYVQGHPDHLEVVNVLTDAVISSGKCVCQKTVFA